MSEGFGERQVEVLCPVPIGQMHQHGEAGRPFDEGADGGAVAGADDAVALPVSWDGTIGGFGWTVADHHHGCGAAGLAPVGLPVRLAHGPSCVQCMGQLPAQFTAALDVKGLVDRLVDHVHRAVLLRRISLLIVDGLRPSSAAMVRMVAFSQRRSATCRPAVAPLTAGPGVDADELARLFVAVAQLHEPEVFLPLPAQLAPGVLLGGPDLEVQCAP